MAVFQALLLGVALPSPAEEIIPAYRIIHRDGITIITIILVQFVHQVCAAAAAAAAS
jgi:hypothetical protein